ncbi:hypothetical protein J6590_064112 [Homalodisca vitripennis]|nr:hypothetical protein J6590_064112 [Homalodisca vitripennis]
MIFPFLTTGEGPLLRVAAQILASAQESGTTNSGIPGRTFLWGNGSGCLQESHYLPELQTIQTGSLEKPTMLETSAAWSFMRRITMATCGTIRTLINRYMRCRSHSPPPTPRRRGAPPARYNLLRNLLLRRFL